MKNNNICVVTSSRADYGLLKYLLKELNINFNLQLIVTGSHNSNLFGNTKKFIDKSIKINKVINIYENLNVKYKFNENYISKTIAKTLKEFGNMFNQHKPDLVIVLGDRYEIFGCSIAAFVNRIPICHIHGGETTSNALDDSFRHCITMLSQIHFVAAKKYYNRVIQLGKHPSTVHLVGGIGPANVKKIKFQNKKLFLKKNKLNEKKYCILIYHTETRSKDYGLSNFKKLLKYLSTIKKINIIVIQSNADTYSDELLSIYNKNRHIFFKMYKSLEYEEFLNLLKYSSFIIGNSSCGIIEAPSLKIPTINVGKRQHGRIRCKSIIDISSNMSELKPAINKVLSTKFIRKIKNVKNPYYHGDTTSKIIKILKRTKDFQTYHNIDFYNLLPLKK